MVFWLAQSSLKAAIGIDAHSIKGVKMTYQVPFLSTQYQPILPQQDNSSDGFFFFIFQQNLSDVT